MNARRLSLYAAGVLLCLGANAALLAQPPTVGAGAPREGGHPESAYRGGLVTPPVPKPRFTLTDTRGSSFDFWSETNGYVTLLFFGYTSCSNVCPMQMSYLAGAFRNVPDDVAERLKVVFVTTDPRRDTPQTLRAWLDRFDKRFIGLRGTEAAVEAAETAAHVPASGGDPDGHVAFVLAYTKDNLAHVIYPAGVNQADWVHDLPQLATETWGSR